MKIYLDNCSLQRPLDDKTQLRISLEAEAVLGIIALNEKEIIEIVHSDALAYEMSRTPHPQRKTFATEVLSSAKTYITFTKAVIDLAKTLEQHGIKPLDALHVACASTAEVHYFCTCDDRLIKRLKTGPHLACTVVTPLELIQEILP